MLESILDVRLQPSFVLAVGIDVLLDRTKLFLQFNELASVVDCRFDLLLVANDSCVAHQGLHVFFVELCNFRY